MLPQSKSTGFFQEKKQTTPTAKVKLDAKYSNIDIDWKNVDSLCFAQHQFKI